MHVEQRLNKSNGSAKLKNFRFAITVNLSIKSTQQKDGNVATIRTDMNNSAMLINIVTCLYINYQL